MKKALLLIIIVFPVFNTYSQDFAGFRTISSTGVNGVFFNPANIADNRYKTDVNLFSISSFIGNNSASFKLKNFTQTFHPDSAAHQFFGRSAGTANGLLSADVHGPSAMFAAGKKTTVAVTTRARLMGNVIDFDGQMVNDVFENPEISRSFPYQMTARNMAVNLNAWTEYGVSIATVLKDAGKHFIKGGITVKLLGGAMNTYMQLGNFNATLNEDVQTHEYLTKTTGSMVLGFSGLPTQNIRATDVIKMKSIGVGLDYGFVYEYRPDFENEDFASARNKYKLKIGVAVLDLGSIKYAKDMQRSGAFKLNITGNNRFYLMDLKRVDFDKYNSFFKSRRSYFVTDTAKNNITKISVPLPSTFQLQVDYHLRESFFINLSSAISLSSSDSAYNSRYFGSVSLTPRFESEIADVFLPINYNKYTKFSAGLGARVGPVFFGSGSFFTSLFGKSKQADAFIGVHINGEMFRKKMGEAEVRRWGRK